MSTYAVTDTVSQISLGEQGVISLVNNGPSTIYLDSLPGASPLNSQALPPTGQITWNATTPLFVVCASGNSSQLIANPGAGVLDANRAKFWSLLSAQTNVPLGSNSNVTVETGHCETLRLRIGIRTGGGLIPPILRLVITWSDTLGNIIDTDVIYVAALMEVVAGTPLQYIFVHLPVIGSVFTVDVLTETGASIPSQTMETFDIYGTDRTLPYSYFGMDPSLIGTASQSPILGYWRDAGLRNGDNNRSDYVSFSKAADFAFPNHCYLANLGNILAITSNILGSSGTAGQARLLVLDFNLTTVLAAQYIAVPGPATALVTYSEFTIPQKSVVIIDSTGALNGTSGILNLKWRNTT